MEAESKEQAINKIKVNRMIKRILKIWFTIAMYELGKWLGRELYYKLSANDEVDKAPNDYANESDQYDINGVDNDRLDCTYTYRLSHLDCS